MELAQQILDFITKNGSVTTAQIVAMSGTTKRTTYRHLNRLIDKGAIVREGIPPSVVYKPTKTEVMPASVQPLQAQPTFIKNDYVTPNRIQSNQTESDRSQKAFLAILAVVAALSVGLFMLSRRGTSGELTTPNLSGKQETMYAAILRHDASTGEYYVLDTNSNRVQLDLGDNASLKRLVGKTIQLPPAIIEWSAELEDGDGIETFEEDFESPEPQL